MKPPLYVTGTNTNVGKTILSTFLLGRAAQRGIKMAALKPVCTGGREDAIQLHALQMAGLSLEQVNPFHFEAAVTPLLAARHSGQPLSREALLHAIENSLALNYPTLIEGAGGLLSPIAEGFNLRDLIRKIPGLVCVVAPNILGTINSVLLTIEALGNVSVVVVLMSPEAADSSTPTNAALIRELSSATVLEFPFLREWNAAEAFPALDTILDLSGFGR